MSDLVSFLDDREIRESGGRSSERAGYASEGTTALTAECDPPDPT